MVMTADPHVALERRLTRRLRDDRTHRLVSVALAEVAASAIYPTDPAAASGPRVHALIEDSVASATRIALDTLIDEIEDLVDDLPAPMVDELVRAQLRA